MKKIFLAVAAMAMLATACTKDDSAVVGNESLVSFTIDSPELQTRYGEGEEATVLHYAFYNEDGILKAISATGDAETGDLQPVTLENKKATIQVPLVEGRTYSAIFWASAPEAAEVYDVDFGAKTVEMATTNLTANNEDYDAFYNYTININPAEKTHKIELRRPFAQINIATADKTAAANAGFNAVATQVTVNAYKKLEFVVEEIDGIDTPVAEVVGDKVSFTYGWAANATGTVEVGGKDYAMLSMNYVLVNDRELVDVKMEVSEAESGADAIVRHYSTVPVQRNYRTYIVGNLLTTTNEFNVTTVPGFNPNDEIYYVWDGSELTKPAYDDATKTYTITKASELAWISALVNGTLPSTMRATEYAPAESIDGRTIVLGDDLDFGGNEFTPIKKALNITFDGNGKAIRNISYAVGTSYSTMFELVSGTFKNLKMENVKSVSKDNNRASALLGYYCGGMVEDVHVKNVEIKGAQKLSGLISFITDCTEATIKDCSVENIKITPSEIDQDGGFVQAAGLVGYISTAKATITFENCEVKGNVVLNGESTEYPTDDDMWAYYSGSFVASMSSSTTVAADASIINFNNCKTVAVQATPALMVSPRAGEFWGDCTTAGFSYLTNTPLVINVNGEQYIYKTASQKAFEAALAEGGEVKLTEDVEIVVPIDIAEDANVTIDLNGKNFTNNTSNGYAFYNQNGGTLRITDTQNGGAVQGVVYTGANSTTIVDGGTFNAAEGGKYVFLNSDGNLTINGATINGGSTYPIYSYDPNSKLVINDATVNAKFGCINSYGLGATVEINGGTFNMTGVQGNSSHIAYFANVDATINGGNFNKNGDINMSGTGGGGICVINGANLTIEGGNFAGDYADVYDWGGTNANGRTNAVSIKGGTYKFNPTATWIAEGYKAVATNGKYMVVAEDIDAVLTEGMSIKEALDNGSSSILLQAGEYSLGGWMDIAGYDAVISGTSPDEVKIVGALGMDSSAKNFTLENVTFEWDGNYDGVNVPIQLKDTKGLVQFKNCVFSGANKKPTGNFGFIHATSGVEQLVVEGCTFDACAGRFAIFGHIGAGATTTSKIINNKLIGGIYNGGGFGIEGPMTVQNVEIKGNTITGYFRIVASSDSHALKNIAIEGNTLSQKLEHATTTNVENVTFKNNKTANGTLWTSPNAKFITE